MSAKKQKLEGWADDLKLGVKNKIEQVRRAATTALTLEKKLAGQKQIKALESHRDERRRLLFEAQDREDQQRAELIAGIEGKLTQKIFVRELFTVHWRLK
jgi:adenine-specific DNA-methyltransferase